MTYYVSGISQSTVMYRCQYGMLAVHYSVYCADLWCSWCDSTIERERTRSEGLSSFILAYINMLNKPVGDWFAR